MVDAGLRLPGRALWLLMRSLLRAGEGERALKMLMEEEAKRRGSGEKLRKGGTACACWQCKASHVTILLGR